MVEANYRHLESVVVMPIGHRVAGNQAPPMTSSGVLRRLVWLQALALGPLHHVSALSRCLTCRCLCDRNHGHEQSETASRHSNIVGAGAGRGVQEAAQSGPCSARRTLICTFKSTCELSHVVSLLFAVRDEPNLHRDFHQG